MLSFVLRFSWVSMRQSVYSPTLPCVFLAEASSVQTIRLIPSLHPIPWPNRFSTCPFSFYTHFYLYPLLLPPYTFTPTPFCTHLHCSTHCSTQTGPSLLLSLLLCLQFSNQLFIGPA
ncbi:hypothetical protein BDQ17DRAFT_1381632 [Cyathus striatus]|nr:hypothetical protein BDQ17DRAFT_1381632 [Cyathus striatus]